MAKSIIAARPDDLINLEEFFEGCLTQKLISVRAGKTGRGTYVVRYHWLHKGLPFGSQFVWLIHSRKEKEINSVVREALDSMAEWADKTLLVDDYDPDHTSLALDLALFSDSRITHTRFALEVKEDGEEAVGNIAVICGQGRSLDWSREEEMMGLLHVLIAKPLASLKNRDPFIMIGWRKWIRIMGEARQMGLKIGPVKPSRFGRLEKSKFSNYGREQP